MIETETANRILTEVTLGVDPKKPDTAEEARYRTTIKHEVWAIEARGGAVQIPND